MVLETCCIPVVKEHIATVFEEGQAVALAPFSNTVVSGSAELTIHPAKLGGP